MKPSASPQMDLYSAEQFLASDFDPDDPYRLFSEKVYPLLLAARPALAEAYCQSNGRPATEPVVMLGVSVLNSWSACRIGTRPST